MRAEYFLPLYTLHLDVGSSANNFYVSDFQLRLLLDLPVKSNLKNDSLYDKYPNLHRRSTSHRTRARLWQPISIMVARWRQKMTKEKDWIQTLTRETFISDKCINLILLDDVVSIVKCDYQALGRQLMTITLDIEFAQEINKEREEEIGNCLPAKFLFKYGNNWNKRV